MKQRTARRSGDLAPRPTPPQDRTLPWVLLLAGGVLAAGLLLLLVALWQRHRRNGRDDHRP